VAQYGQTWVWAALESATRLVVCYLVGDRTLESCRAFLTELSSRVDNIPLFTSDELPHYKTILSEIYRVLRTQYKYSEEIAVEKTGKRGRPRKSVKKIDPDLDYATVHKTRENGKVVKVEGRIVYGDQKRIEEKIARGPGKKVNTSYIERFNGTARQNDSHLRRKSLTFAKEIPHFEARLAIIVLFYNCIRAHGTLSKNPDKTCTPRTPALAANLIKKNWTFEAAYKKPLII